MSVAISGRRRKIKKKGLAKTLRFSKLNAQQSLKTKDEPKCKLFKISYLELFFLKILFRAYTFFKICSDFLEESPKANKNQRERSLILQYKISFAQNASLILRASTYLALKVTYSRNTAKVFLSLQVFQPIRFFLVSEKNIRTASFLDAQELHS